MMNSWNACVKAWNEKIPSQDMSCVDIKVLEIASPYFVDDPPDFDRSAPRIVTLPIPPQNMSISISKMIGVVDIHLPRIIDENPEKVRILVESSSDRVKYVETRQLDRIVMVRRVTEPMDIPVSITLTDELGVNMTYHFLYLFREQS
jgi:hypothetical protein